MFDRILKQANWADGSFYKGLFKMVYFNTLKKNRFLIYELKVEDLEEKLENEIQGKYEIKILTNKELEMYLPKKKLYLPREFSMHEIHGVENCTVVLYENEIAHICWIYKKGDKNRWFNLKEDEVHYNYGFTFPEYRGEGLFPKGLLVTGLWLKKRGYRRILMDVHEDTIFMVRSLKKVAAVKNIGTLTHWFIFRPKFKEKGKFQTLQIE